LERKAKRVKGDGEPGAGKLARRVRRGGRRNVLAERPATRCVLTLSLSERHDAYTLGVKNHTNYYDEETRKALTQALAVGYYEQKRELVEIKECRPEYNEIASHVLQDVILRLKKTLMPSFVASGTASSPATPCAASSAVFERNESCWN
jgi:hypothetical protein